ncbi:MAG: hypothetical protein FWG37_02735 [Clostridia bacterium]|nr:hypothetical protein [Clostridia bacterium]
MRKALSVFLVLFFVFPALAAVADDFSYPMDGSVSLTWYVAEGFGDLNPVYATWDECPFYLNLMELTGVNIDYSINPAGADGAQTLNLVLASSTLPDLIFGGLATDAERHMEEGTIRDLTPYIQEWAPNYYAWLQSNPAYDKAMKTDEGKYYGFGFFREDGGWNDTYQGPVVRQDWLDACGLETPVTIADWDNALKVFNDTYGATFGFPMSRFRDSGIAGAFGAYGAMGQAGSSYRYFIDENDTVQYAQAQPEWREFLLKMQEWWVAGLIDQDIFTMQDSDARSKALAGTLGITYTSMGQMSNWRRDADESATGADWVGLQYPHGNDDTLCAVFGGPGIGNPVAVVTGDCAEDKIEAAMRMLDYAYTPEGNLFWNFGKQGESWDYDENGVPAYLPLVTEDPDGINEAISKYGGSTWSGPCIQATALLYMKNTQQSIDANDLWFYPNEAVAGKGKMPVGLTLTADESDEIANIESSLTTYVPEMFAKFITGEAGASDWDAYVQELDNMGLQRALEIRQTAYDRYLSR